MRLLYFSLHFSDDSHEFQKHQLLANVSYFMKDANKNNQRETIWGSFKLKIRHAIKGAGACGFDKDDVKAFVM
jgi:hypothetical protein